VNGTIEIQSRGIAAPHSHLSTAIRNFIPTSPRTRAISLLQEHSGFTHAKDLPTRGYLRDQRTGIEFQSTNRIFCKTRTHVKHTRCILSSPTGYCSLENQFAPTSTRKQIMPYFKMLTHEMTMASDIEIPSEKEDNQVRDL